MNQRVRRLTAGLAFIICTLLAWALAFWPSEQSRIARTIRDMAQLCEARDAAGLAAYIAPNYCGTIGSTRDEAIENSRRAFADMDSLSISILHIETDVESGRAQAMVAFQSAGTVILADTNARLPFKNITADSDLKVDLVYLEFIKSGDRWLLEHVTFDTRQRLPRFPRTVAFLARQ